MNSSTREKKKIKYCRHSDVNYTYKLVLYATMITRTESTAKLQPSTITIICKFRCESCISLTLAA